MDCCFRTRTSGGGGTEPPPPEKLCYSSTTDRFLNPFNKNCFAHQPVGVNAEYAALNSAMHIDLQRAANIGANLNIANGWGHNFEKNKPSDPMRTVTWNGRGSGAGIKNNPLNIRIPVGWSGDLIPPIAYDSAASLFDATGDGKIHQFYYLELHTGGAYTAQLHYVVDPDGTAYSATNDISSSASGIPQTTTILRGHEWNTNDSVCHHALNFGFPRKSDQGFEGRMLGTQIWWPATTGDSGYLTNNKGNIPYGALIVLAAEGRGGPPLTFFGPVNSFAWRVAKTFRYRGAYVVDGVDNPKSRCDEFVNTSLKTPYANVTKEMWPYFRIITNNNPGTATRGGGAPLDDEPNCAFDSGAPRG